jgi:hypothetical protein
MNYNSHPLFMHKQWTWGEEKEEEEEEERRVKGMADKLT